MKKILLLFAVITLFLTNACENDPIHSVTPTSIIVGPEGDTVFVTVTSNCRWRAESNNPAITIDPKVQGEKIHFRNTAETIVTKTSIIVPPNLETNSISSVIEFDGTNGCVTVSILQKPKIISFELEKTKDTLTHLGGNSVVNLFSNHPWSSSTDSKELIIAPASGNGNAEVTITVPENTTYNDINHIVTFVSDRISIDYTIVVSQSTNPRISIDPSEVEIGYEGGDTIAKVTSNYDWTASADPGVTLTVLNDDNIKASISSINCTNEPILYKAYFECEYNGSKAYDTLTITHLPPTVLSYGGVDYKIKCLADGRIWMCENLRYVPQGKNISDDPTDNNGIWYSCGTNKEADKTPESIAQKGLLYDVETAFGGVTLNVDNFGEFESVQGICPDGWYIPNINDFLNLVGKGIDYLEDNESAPYFDSATGKSSITLANEDSFNIATYGYRNQDDITTTGAYFGDIYNGNLSSDMIMGSSVIKIDDEPSYTPFDDDYYSIKNIRFFSIMPSKDASNNSLDVAYNNYKSGVHVRCIRARAN